MSGSDESLVYVGLGSNLGEPERQIQSALGELSRVPHTRLVQSSRLFRTPPWGGIEQPEFVNAAAKLATRLSPRELLEALLAIERAHGRHRDGTRWGPRMLDLDILLFGDLRIGEVDLAIPHPHIAERAFVLLPLADLDADLVVPGHGTVRELLEHIDTGGCTPLD